MREPANIRELAALNPDYMGFIFYEQSKRFVGSLKPESLNIDSRIKKTGVFVNAELDYIKDQIELFGLQAIQLHGGESPELCNSLRQTGCEVIKAFGISESFDFDTLNPYIPVVDFFLFDTASAQHGGTGISFNWQLLNEYKAQIPYFLSGGIDLAHRQEIQNIQDTRLYAIDINSRFELEPGLKDIDKIKKFIFNQL